MASNNIFYLNPCTDKILFYDGQNFNENTSLTKNDFVSSRVHYDDVILHSFKISNTTSQEEIKSSIELKMYEDVGLDLQKEYKITHIVKELEFEDMFLVEAFAIEKTSILDRLKDVLKKTSYIDFLALPFLSFTTLYKNKIIAPKNDVFVYFDNSEAFIALYKDGHYLSTKSLLNLEDIIHALEKKDILIDFNKLEEILLTKGLDADSYTQEDFEIFSVLERIFSDIFTKINHVVIHNRSIFGFEKVDRLFFGTQFGRIKGLKEISANFFSSDFELLDFNIFQEKVNSNFFNRIVASYAYDVFLSDNIEQDITFFKRKKPFFKSEVGKLSLFTSFLILALSIYPAYLLYDISLLEQKNLQISKKYDIVKRNTQNLRVSIKTANEVLNESQKEIEIQGQRIENISQSIEQLYDIKITKKGSSNFLEAVNNLLYKYNLSAKNINLVDVNHMNIEVFSSITQRDTIALFMKDLIKNGFLNVTTKEIKLDNNRYISVVEIAQ